MPKSVLNEGKRKAKAEAELDASGFSRIRAKAKKSEKWQRRQTKEDEKLRHLEALSSRRARNGTSPFSNRITSCERITKAFYVVSVKETIRRSSPKRGDTVTTAFNWRAIDRETSFVDR